MQKRWREDPSTTLRMTEVVGNWQLSIINYQLSIVNFGAPVWGRQIRKKYLPFLGRAEKCRRGAAFRDFQKMKMGKNGKTFSQKCGIIVLSEVGTES